MRWRKLVRTRPERIETPGPGQESVWDYPRPPRLEPTSKRIRVEFGGLVLADTRGAYRVLETASPPVFYLPPEDVQMDYLAPAAHSSFCEWKGTARYWSLRVANRRVTLAAWSYPEPLPDFEVLANYLAFFPQRMERCSVDGEPATPQPGEFYGGWVTRDIRGPFKGEPGSETW